MLDAANKAVAFAQGKTRSDLDSNPKPWPDYITLLVFLAKENSEPFLQRYQMLVDKYNQIEIHKGDGQ